MLPRIALLLAVLTPVLHSIVLAANGAYTYQDPISALSQGPWGSLHTIAVVLFGTAQILLAITLGGLDRGHFWPLGRALLAASGVMLFLVAYIFSTAAAGPVQGTEAFDPLWVVATLAGFAMGLLQPGFKRLSPQLGRLNAIFLGIWIILIPATLLIGIISIGTYERAAGITYVAWVAGISHILLSVSRKTGRQA